MSKSSDPRTKQVLWSKSLWKSNPSGSPEIYTPPKRSRPAPLRSVPSSERGAHNVALRGDRTTRTERADRVVSNRARLQSYRARERDTDPSEAHPLGAKSERTVDRADATGAAADTTAPTTSSHRGRIAGALSRHTRG